MFFERLKRHAAISCLVGAAALTFTTSPISIGAATALPAAPLTSEVFGVGDHVQQVQNRNRPRARRAYRQGRQDQRRITRRKMQRRYHNGRWYYWDNNGWWYDGGGAAVAAAAGIAGLLAGAALAAPRGRTIILENQGVPAPYTAAWYQQCDLKYNSFRSSDGTYLGFDGFRHTCTLP
jgi:hypothetical protein